MRVPEVASDQVGLTGGAVILHDRMDHRGGKDGDVVLHRIEDEVGVVRGGEGIVLLEGVAGLLRGELAAVGEEPGQDLGMERHHDVEDALVAGLAVAQPLGLALGHLLQPVGAGGEIPGQHADKGRDDGAEGADDRGHEVGCHCVAIDRLLPRELPELYSMAGDRSKCDGVEAASKAGSGSADQRTTKPKELAKENLDGVEAASQADPSSANYWADQ